MSEKLKFGERGGWWVAAQIPLLLAVGILAPLTSRAAGALTLPLRYLGGLGILIGAAIVVAGLATLGESLTPFPRPRGGAVLMTHGVYRFIRHPVYSGLILGSFGWASMWSSPEGVLVALLVVVFFDRKAAREEAWLMQRYPGYAAYARRVRRFLPGIY